MTPTAEQELTEIVEDFRERQQIGAVPLTNFEIRADTTEQEDAHRELMKLGLVKRHGASMYPLALTQKALDWFENNRSRRS